MIVQRRAPHEADNPHGPRGQLHHRGEVQRYFEFQVQILCPDRSQQREVRILNKVVTWTDAGIVYEAE